MVHGQESQEAYSVLREMDDPDLIFCVHRVHTINKTYKKQG